MDKKVEENAGQCLADNIEASEPGNARRLANATKGLYKYVPKAKSWYVYDHGHWVEDVESILLIGLSKKVPQHMYEMAAEGLSAIGPCPTGEKMDGRKTKTEEQQARFDADQSAQEKWMANAGPFLAMKTWADKSNNEAQLRHMVSLVRDLPGISIEYEAMDAQPNLINFLNGTYDAETDTLRPHDPADLLIKQCPVNFIPDAQAPLWLKCLHTWQPNSDNLAFLQRITGSAMVGDAVQNLFAHIGPGSNGKDSYFTPIQTVLGPYAVVASEDMIVDSGNSAHDEDLARLKGTRLVLFPETNQGAKLNTARLKNITGGGRIRARHLYGKPFDIIPTYTAFMHSNHGLRITETDNGIWRRYIEIPWDVTITEAERDLQLGNKLLTELEGIAQWMVEGVRQWRKHGLSTPPEILERTEGVRQAQDLIGRFLEESWEQVVSSEGYVKSTDLRRMYVAWCEAEGVKPWTQSAVGNSLTSRGFGRKRRRIGTWTGHCWTAPGYNPNALTSSVTHVTPYPLTADSGNNRIEERIKEKEEGGSKGVTGHSEHTPGPNVDPEVDSEEIPESGWFKAHNRQFLTERGYPVPPTDEELEAHYADMAAEHAAEELARQIELEEHYAHKHATEDPDDQYKPDWVE